MMVYQHWPVRITQREIAALGYMALIALDADEPPRFFAGWQELARAIGIDPDDNEQLARRNTLKVLKGLRQAGAVVSSGQARAGVRAEYALALDPEYTFRPVGRGRKVQWERVSRPEVSASKADAQTERGELGERVHGGHTSVSKMGGAACPKRTEQGVQIGHSKERVQERVQEQAQDIEGGLENLSTGHAGTCVALPLYGIDDDAQSDERARKVLSSLPDFGANLLARARATDPELTSRQARIKAAEAHSSTLSRPARSRTPSVSAPLLRPISDNDAARQSERLKPSECPEAETTQHE